MYVKGTAITEKKGEVMNFVEYTNKVEKKEATTKQREVIKSDNYPSYLKAGAGTGKTEVLVQKIVDIIAHKEGIGLDNFAIITFTNKATDEMKERIGDRLYYEWLKHSKSNDGNKDKEFMRKQAEICNMLYIATIHGFCEKILRKYGLNIGIALNFKIKSIKHKLKLTIGEVAEKYYNTYEEEFAHIREYKIVELLESIYQDINNKGIVLDKDIIAEFHFIEEGNEYWNKMKDILLNMYSEIDCKMEEYKQENNILCVDDLIKKTAEVVQIEYVLNKVADKYKYVFIDEYQDSNKSQNDLVNALKDKGVKVFLVGDDKQSIYAFRGADIQNSKNMFDNIYKPNYQTRTILEINENFRTDWVLLRKINEVFRYRYFYNGSQLDFPNMELDKIESLKNEEEGIVNPFRISFKRSVIEIINELYDKEEIRDGDNVRKVRYSDIGVLCRSNFDLDVLGNQLKIAKIPVEILGGKGFFRAKEVIDTYKVINSAIQQNQLHQDEVYFTDYYSALCENSIELCLDTLLKELEVELKINTVEGVLNFLYERTGIVEYYKRKKQLQAVGNLNKLIDKARDLMDKDFIQPIQFVEYLGNMIITGQEDEEAPVTQDNNIEGCVKLYSIHKAKGLAFNIVIIPKIEKNLTRDSTRKKVILDVENKQMAIDARAVYEGEEDRDYNRLLQDDQKEVLEEELRILYVGLTRPKHLLILSTERDKKIINSKYEDQSWLGWIKKINNGEFIKKHIW